MAPCCIAATTLIYISSRSISFVYATPSKALRITEEQIAFALHQAETGVSVEEVCHEIGISQATFYAWKKKYGGIGVSELRRLRQLEDENANQRDTTGDLPGIACEEPCCLSAA